MNAKSLPILLLSIFIFSSCLVSREQHGNFEKDKYATETVKKGKDFYLFWNQLPVKKVDNQIKIKDYEKIIKRDVFDAIVFYGTLGIFSFYSVEIIAPKKNSSKEKNKE